MSQARCIGFEPKYLRAYQAFARKGFGPRAYQAEESYINWLYADNPHGAVMAEDFHIAVTDDERVVACAHTMRLPWQVNGQFRTIAAGHNLMVAEEHRTGVGLTILMKNLKGRSDLLVPAVTAPLDVLYRKLGAQPVETHWFRKVLRPIAGGMQLGMKKLLKRDTPPSYFTRTASSSFDVGAPVRVDADPNDELVQQVAKALNANHVNHAAPYWDAELLRWRFFHLNGPRHALVYLPSDDSVREFLIVSLGPRNGLNVGRVIAASIGSEHSLHLLIGHAETLIKKCGGTVLLTFCADANLSTRFQSLGWKEVPNPPQTFIYHTNKTETFDTCSFMGFAGDIGFEAIPLAA